MREMRPACYVFLGQTGMRYDTLRDRACAIEALGYDGLWLIDHMFAKEARGADFLDGWTTIAALAEATTTLRLGVLVSCNSFRNPGVLAKLATTADHVSNGRVELGIGAGWMEEEYDAYGFEFPRIGVRLEQLGEALDVITSLFANERTTFEGRHYRFTDAPFAPKPVQTPLPITIGGSGPRVLMRYVAEYAQRWNCPMPAAGALREHVGALAAHCGRIGRDPAEIVVSEQVAVILGRDEADYRAKREEAETTIGDFVDLQTMPVCGTPNQVAAALQTKLDAGVTDFAILFGDLCRTDCLELFADRVAPQLTCRSS